MGFLGKLFGGEPRDKREGEEFLAANATKDGVKTTASGLQYKVLTAASGDKPTVRDTVKVHYEGRLINGTVFDKREVPVSFPLDGVIKGWTEGLQLMAVGAKYELYIPYNLAYGQRGSPPRIPPFAALIFVIELLEIES